MFSDVILPGGWRRELTCLKRGQRLFFGGGLTYIKARRDGVAILAFDGGSSDRRKLDDVDSRNRPADRASATR